MAQFPALPLWTDAYLADTTHLSTIEHGAYLLLLMAMWRSKDCSLPSDDKILAKYCKLNSGQWSRIKLVIMPFFTAADGVIRQGRLTDEATFVKQHSTKQSNSAKARWLKTNNTGDAVAMPNACQTDAPTPTPTPLRDSPNGESPLNPPNECSGEKTSKRGTRLPDGAVLSDEFRAFAISEGHRNAEREWENFTDYWRSQPGAKGVKLDWFGTWRIWVRRSVDDGKKSKPSGGQRRHGPDLVEADRATLAAYTRALGGS